MQLTPPATHTEPDRQKTNHFANVRRFRMAEVACPTRGWRRRRDSNPRYAFGAYNGLANRRLQPLGHVSAYRPTYRRRISGSNAGARMRQPFADKILAPNNRNDAGALEYRAKPLKEALNAKTDCSAACRCYADGNARLRRACARGSSLSVVRA